MRGAVPVLRGVAARKTSNPNTRDVLSESERETLIRTRRDLHRHPELGYREHRTAGIVAERLRAAGYDVRTGIAGTGVVGTLRGEGGDGPTLMLRADMDALPIREETSHDFPSETDGVMHACGHDGHVAIGLAVAERLTASRDEWPGAVRYLFQPAEEGLRGASRMVEEGVLGGVDAALGLHLWTGLPSGAVGVVPGPFMAGAAMFRITVHGRGGHGAEPHHAVDPVVVGSHVVTSLQSIVSRGTAPTDDAVVTVGSFRAGEAGNVIADTAVLEGTLRAFEPEVLGVLERRISEVARGVAEALGARCDVDIGTRIPPVINDPRVAAMVGQAAEETVGPDRMFMDADARVMVSEDFGEFLQRVPGCFFFVGGQNRDAGAVHPHHSPRFDICEDALPVAVEVLERAAVKLLSALPASE